MIDPYCGIAPVPAELLGRWNFDPVLLTAMALAAGAHAALLWREGPSARRRKAAHFGALWLLLLLVFVSPLCALTSALFSARVVHHVVLVAVAAPIAVLALPDRWRNIPATMTGLSLLALVHMALLWFWHAPAPYQAALSSHALFWLMELSLFASAVALWLAVLSPRAGVVPALVALLATVVQMGLLGAAITFARTPLYAAHAAVTEPWGVSALEDQQLAGLIMWVPAALPYLVAALLIAGARLTRIEGANGRAL